MTNRTLTIALVAALAAMACGNKKDDKEATFNRVCAKIRDEDLAKCTDDACKKSVQETFDACKSLGKTVAAAGKGGGKSLAEQADDAEKKCNSGDADSCATIGGAYLLGKGGKVKDEAKGVALVKKACDAKSAFGCEIYARALDEGKGVAVDQEGAKKYFQMSCDLGGGGGCRALSLKLEVTDPARIPLLDKACQKDDKIGCMGLGAAYLHGNQGAPKDLAKAKQFLQKSCDLGAATACDKVKEIQ